MGSDLRILVLLSVCLSSALGWGYPWPVWADPGLLISQGAFLVRSERMRNTIICFKDQSGAREKTEGTIPSTREYNLLGTIQAAVKRSQKPV